eukprot:321964_1
MRATKLYIGLFMVLYVLLCHAEQSGSKYEERGPCQYCKYCAFCDECRHCPCESKGPDDLPYCEYCPYCKYCSYCKLCDYCEEGGALSRFTQSVAALADSVLNLFQKPDRDLAQKAKEEFGKDNVEDDEKLKQDKLDEIDEKYKDKLKKEV